MYKMTLGEVKALFDKHFSDYTRLRDCGDREGYESGKCISCVIKITYKTCHLGHYRSRHDEPRIIYYIPNSNAQCPTCNIFMESNQKGQRRGITLKYGKKELDYLDEDHSDIPRMTSGDYWERMDEISNAIIELGFVPIIAKKYYKHLIE